MPLLYPASTQAEDLRSVWIVFLCAVAFVALFVYALIAICLIRWRARGDALPPQFKENPPLEIAGVVIPLLIVIGLFGVTYFRELPVDKTAPHPYATVDVKGFQWSWQFVYPGYGITRNGTPQAPPELVLPLREMTQINLYSADVDHAFWIPAFLFKRDALPGYTNHFDVTPTRLGTYDGKCAEFCGLNHALMTFTVRVVPAAKYTAWLKSGGTLALGTP